MFIHLAIADDQELIANDNGDKKYMTRNLMEKYSK